MTTYTVATAQKQEREPEIKGSKFYSYTLTFWERPQEVQMLQKPETPAPRVGDVLEGTIEPGREKDDGGKWPDKFKKASQGGFKPRSPQETASIVRQHSQHMALLFLQHGIVRKDWPLDNLKPIIDWFDADVASVNVPSKAPTEPPKPQREAVPTIPLDRAKRILEAAVWAGLAEYGDGKELGPLLKPTLKAKLVDVGNETGLLGHLNVDQAEEVEAWIAKEGKDARGSV